MRWKPSPCRSIVVLLALSPGVLHAQHYGFGMVKKTVTLERRLLPDVRLGQGSVQVVFPRGAGGLDANLFSSDLETEVAQNSGGLRLVSQKPEYEIRCFTTAYQPAQITARTEAAPKFLGKPGKPNTEREAHGNISLDARLTRVSDGAVLVAFSEAVSLNASSSAAPGSTSVTLPQIRIPGLARNSSPTQPMAAAADPLADTDTNASLTGRMIKTLSLRVASHLVQMNEQITVLLGQGGALDDASRLAINGRWSEYLEKLSSLTPPPDPADNAYLLYNLGVANEALGYAAGDAKATLKYLQESSIDYTRATEGKPNEKYFADPQKRIETAITRYTRLAEQEHAPPAATRRQEPERRAKAGERLTNADIIKLVKARLDKSLILNKIATAPEADFDLSVDGMVALSQSGVPSDIIRAMTVRTQKQETASPH